MVVVRELDIVPLGGLGEVGMNCLCLEYGDTRVIVDAGLTFPDLPCGADVIHPDFSYLRANPRPTQAIVLTHGHEDHVGALPFLLEAVQGPVYGPAYALAMARERLSEFPAIEPPAFHLTVPGKPLQLGELTIEPFRVAHSIPDCTGLIVRSPAGTVVHTGDFRIDRNPPDGEALDEAALAEVGATGVRLLLSDSTNVERESLAGSEAQVAERLLHHARRATGRVVVSMFASNIYRLQAVVRTAQALDRKLLLMGRSIQTHARIAAELGKLPALDTLRVHPEEARRLPPHRLLVGATGSQGELRAALQRLAQGTHPALALTEGDLVIHSARIIPGKERVVYRTFDALARRGIQVVHRGDDPAIHVSGHAPRADQRRMIELTQPATFVPVHGTFHHLVRHAELAQAAGVPEVVVIENGQRLRLGAEQTRVLEHEPADKVHIQAGRAVPKGVLRERALMAEVGICIVILTLDPQNRPLTPARVFTRGVVWEDSSQELLQQLAEAAQRAAKAVGPNASENDLHRAVAQPVRARLQSKLGFSPPVHCVVQRP